MRKNDLVYLEFLEYTARNVRIYDINTVISEFDEKVYASLMKGSRSEVANHLSDLCYTIIELPEDEQLFILKVYLIGMVTELMIQDSRNGVLLPNRLAHLNALIKTIQKWQYTSEVLISVPWFVDNIMIEATSHINFLVQNPHIEKVLQLINENLKNKKLSVRWLAKEIRISSTYLSNMFKNEIGETIINYINKRKVEQIAFELKYTNKSLSELHLNYGYPNKSYFIQVFKKYAGQTPLKYRQEVFK